MRIGDFEKWPFFESAILNFFASSLWKLATNYVLEWMGLKFYDYDGLQPKISPPKHFSRQCTYYLSENAIYYQRLILLLLIFREMLYFVWSQKINQRSTFPSITFCPGNFLYTQPRPSEISMKKLEGKGEARFDTPFMIQSHAESMKKIVGAL